MKKRLLGVGLSASLSACGPVYCVARGSRVRTPGGERAIEDLRAGDEVVAVDPATGATAVSRLMAVIGSTRECGTLSFGARRLCVTSDHPLYDPVAKGFFPAGDWLLGARTHLAELTEAGLEVITVDGVEVFSRVDEVFDLTVEHAWHTFVAEGVLVHNKQPAQCLVPDGGGFVSYTGNAPGNEPCTCADGGVGRWSCTSTGGDAVCVACGSRADGGVDGGP
ncbi:MAG: Hint domain-containing protein [Myxococcaceae bacterium]|nr:Hint domain-containing protein [Myxococcaceae bacterium]